MRTDTVLWQYLIWRDIPQKAILHTIEAGDLLRFARSQNSIRAALRLDILDLDVGLGTQKVPMLQEGEVQLRLDIVAGLAQLCIFFGLDAHSQPEHLSHM